MRRLGMAVVLCLMTVGSAFGYSGSGSVWARKTGQFTDKNFNGDSVGVAASIAWCSPSGTVSIGPGLDAVGIGTIPSNVVVTQFFNGSWRVRGPNATTTTPRLGPASTPTTGGAIRIVDGVTFAMTVAGVQAAIEECNSAGGGTVWVPSNAGILLVTTPVRLKNKVILRAFGQKTHDNGSVFTANASTNVPYAITNHDTTGGQQYAGLDGITIEGNKSSGARIDAGIYLKSLFVGSEIRNCRVANVSGVGIALKGTTGQAFGGFRGENLIVNDTGDNNILIFAGMRHVDLEHIECDRPGRNMAAIKIDGTQATGGGSVNVALRDLYTELSDSMSVGVLIDGASGVTIDDYTAVHPSGRFRAAVQIKNSVPGNFAFSPSGLSVRNLYADSDTLIENQYTTEVITTGADVNNPYRHVVWYSPAIAKGAGATTNGYRNSGQVIGIQQTKKAPDLTSAATIAPHPDGSDFDVTGTTTVTSITGLPYFLWKTTCFWTSAALQFTDGSNLNLNGNFVGNATGGKDCLCAKWDGANWNEVSRSLN